MQKEKRLGFVRQGLQAGLAFGLTWVGVFLAITGTAAKAWLYIAWIGVGYALLYSIAAALSWKSASTMETSEQRESRILASLDLPAEEQERALQQSKQAQRAWETQWYVPEEDVVLSKWEVASWMALAAVLGSAFVWIPLYLFGLIGLVGAMLLWIIVLVWVHHARAQWRTMDFLIDLMIPILASGATYVLIRWLG